MLTITITSLSGGQGKTTSALFLGRLLSRAGLPTLMLDSDPQHNLTTYLGFELEPNQPTLLEFLKKTVAPEDSIYPTDYNDNLFLIPADDQRKRVGQIKRLITMLGNSYSKQVKCECMSC